MNVSTQKRIAAQILKCSPKRVVFDPEKLPDIKEAITKADIRTLVKQEVIRKLPKRGISKSRARAHRRQLRKGQRRGHGTRKGKRTARMPKKRAWKQRVRLQRLYLRGLKKMKRITPRTYQSVYLKVKGGFFRSKRHLLTYIKDQNLTKK